MLFVALFLVIRAAWGEKNQDSVQFEEVVPPPISSALPSSVPSPAPVASTQLTLLFGGDLQFDRHIRQQAQKNGGYAFIFEELTATFAATDGVVANLEGPVTTFDSISAGSAVGSPANFLFTFSPDVLPVLTDNNFVAVNLGNNHILNFGQEGLEQTYTFLNNANLAYWGDVGGSTWLQDSFFLHEQEGVRLLLVNYNQFLGGSVEELLAEMPKQVAATNPDFVVVYPHWGVEYQTTAGPYYQDLARQFVAAGADLIIGTHPHVVQQSEVIDGVPVYYSLGNFVFDQYFEPAVQRGLLLRITFTKGSPELHITEIPIALKTTGATVLAE